MYENAQKHGEKIRLKKLSEKIAKAFNVNYLAICFIIYS